MMARPDETEVVRRLEALRVLPVASVETADEAEQSCRALARGGLPCIEIAFRTPVAAEAIRLVRQVEGVLVGAGTVLSPEQASAAAASGAHFAVSPGTNPEVVESCRKLGLPFFPGVATSSEIERARALGLKTLKVFPISTLGGVAFLRAVSAAYSDVRFLPTGGISRETLADYLSLPYVVACGGSWLVDRTLLRDGRFTEIEQLAREAVELAR